MADDSRLVYSSGKGRVCPGCGEPADGCVCRKGAEPAKGDGIVRISLETKGRGGKSVTVINGFFLGGDDLAKLAKELKARLGTGGTVRDDGTIEIQGDRREAVMKELKTRGFPVKGAH